MLQNGHAVTQKTFHYLLMGCLKDKETGFRLALQVDAQNIFTLRFSVKVGNLESSVLQSVVNSTTRVLLFQNQKLFIAVYIYVYKQCVMVDGATIDNDINNNKQ